MGFTIFTLAVSAILLFFLPKALQHATDKKAGDIATSYKTTLDSLLKWRDSTIAIISSLVVLQVAVVGKTNSNTHLVANISIATVVPYISTTIMLIIIAILPLSFNVTVNLDTFFERRLWQVCVFCIVLIIYALTAFFLIIS